MAINLKEMSHKDLMSLKDDIEKALVKAEKSAREEALKAAQKAAAAFGYSLDEISGKKSGAGKSRAKAAPKYRNPDNAEQTWTGRGRKPQWIHDAIARGVDIADLEI
jgi:DNA-binding protein H-NS